jgi:hypothetical protein
VTEGPELHRQAALRHEQAASNHERAATFWDRQGKDEHAALQRELAGYELQGAELERQWAMLIEPTAAGRAADAALSARSLTRKNAQRVSSVLDRTAKALDVTASIADQHARRREQAGLDEGALEERRVAERARQYAERARSQAGEWHELATRA